MTFTTFSNMSQRDVACLVLNNLNTHWSHPCTAPMYTLMSYTCIMILEGSCMFCLVVPTCASCALRLCQAARGSDLLVACRSGWRPESTRSSFRTKKTCCNHCFASSQIHKNNTSINMDSYEFSRNQASKNGKNMQKPSQRAHHLNNLALPSFGTAPISMICFDICDMQLCNEVFFWFLQNVFELVGHLWRFFPPHLPKT